MGHDPDGTSARSGFTEAARAFVELVGSIDPAQLALPATPAWTVIELVGHTARALLTVELAVAAPVDPASRHLASAAEYFTAALSVPGVHAGILDRARASTEQLGDDPVVFVTATAERVLALVERTSDHQIVQHFTGRISFCDYLVTRVVELVLHTVDLQLALGRAPSAPPGAAAATRDVVVELAGRADALTVASVLTGRAAPAGCDVLG